MASTSRQSATHGADESRLEGLAHFVDLERYPIHDLTSPRVGAIIARGQEMMRDEALCQLPNFLTAEGTEELAGEISSLEDRARRNDHLATAYGWMNNKGFADDHERRLLHRRDVSILTTEQLAPDGPSMVLFMFDELTEFVRRLLGFDTLYRWACPTLGVMINVMREDQCFGWHYDANDYAVSLMVQDAERGGAFEWAPFIRDEGDENYPGVRRLFEGHDPPRSTRIPAGTFTLFLGRRSMHRVAPVGATDRARMTLLYSYDRKPDMVSPESVCRRVLYPTTTPFLGLESLAEDGRGHDDEQCGPS